MGGQKVNGSWLSALWPVTRKSASELDDKAVVGILALEVASLMLKVINLWQSLSDGEVMRMREGIVDSVGVKMLVSQDDDLLMELALNEILENFKSIARSVARLGKRCVDPVYHRYEHFVSNPAQNYLQWSGWEYRCKKMERKVKKMEKIVAAMTQYSQELEVLAELEQTSRRMQANPELHRAKVLEFQKKVTLQRQEVRNLRDTSPWNRSYDYVVRLLARSLFTILERIILVFQINHLPTDQQQNDSLNGHGKNFLRSHSFSVLMHYSVHPAENDLYGFNSENIGRRPASNSGFVADKSKRKKKQQQLALHPPALCGKDPHLKGRQLGHIAAITGCMSAANNSPVIQNCTAKNGGSMRLTECSMKNIDKMITVDKSSLSSRIRIYSKLSFNNRLNLDSYTLGATALALHYANMVVLIERIVSSPHIINPQTRDDLYNMLPTTIRTVLRTKLKQYPKSKHSSVYDPNLAAEWNREISQILEWLAPLAHNMIRWHSVRNFEKDSMLNSNILLVQTLYFADQAKTEGAIIDLLVGLNFVCRIDRKVEQRDTMESAETRLINGVCFRKNRMYNEFL